MFAQQPAPRPDRRAHDASALQPTRESLSDFSPRPLHHGVVPRALSLGRARFTVVSGPVGSGKTTLLARWFETLRAQGRPVAWVTLDFRTRRLEDLIRTVRQAARASDDEHIEGTSESIDLRAPAELVVFLDNADHLIPETITLLQQTMDGRNEDGGSKVRIVAARRACWDTSRLGTDSSLISSITHRDLAFSDTEARALLRNRGIDVRPGEDSLVRFAGWPTGLHLVADEFEKNPVEQPLDLVRGWTRSVQDILDAEVFLNLGDHDQRFLLDASVLNRLTPDACKVVTGDEHAPLRLARLAQLNALVLTADAAGTAYEWAPFAQEFLSRRLRLVRTQAEVERLGDRMRAWALASDDIESALEQTLLTEDWDNAVKILLRHGVRALYSGKSDVLLSAIASLPPKVLGANAGVCAIAAGAEWAAGRNANEDRIVDWLALARSSLSGAPPHGCPSLELAIDITEAACAPISWDQRRRLSEASLVQLTERYDNTSVWLSIARINLAASRFFDDDLDASLELLSDALRSERNVANPSPARRGILHTIVGRLAVVHAERGEAAQTDAFVAAGRVLEGTASSRASVALSEALATASTREPDAAIASLLAHSKSSNLHSGLAVLALLEVARLNVEQGRPSEATAALVTAEHRIKRCGWDAPPALERRRRAVEQSLENDRAETESATSALTARELEVLTLLETDLSRREIGEQLFLAHNTVKTYVQRLYQQLGVNSRPAAVARARELGWLS